MHLSSSWWLWLAIVLCCWLLLLVCLFWRPVASARPGVFPVRRLGLVFLLIDVLGLLPALGCLLCFGGCGWRLSFGALGLLPVPCVRLRPLDGCGLGLVFVFRLFGASARSGVFIFPLVVVVGALGPLPALLCFFSLWLLWWAFVFRCRFLVGSVCSVYFFPSLVWGT